MKEKTKLKTVALLICGIALNIGMHLLLSASTAGPIVNQGISFNQIFPGITLVNLGLSGMLLYWFWQAPNWGTGLMISGALSNLFDRIVRGGVVDYWKIPATGIFNNINDWLIAAGVVILIKNLWTKRNS
ncbi:MAG TPA: signal peptidase II [Patescibacteria group bacterium]